MLFLLVVGVGMICSVQCQTSSADIENLKSIVAELEKRLQIVSRQLMLQQFFTEERIRTEGQSGVKVQRLRDSGTRSYHVDSIDSGSSILAIHDHANYNRLIGMGEVAAVINGVDFRTRHNDYQLVMPSLNSKEYKKTDDIPFPEVPPSVLALTNITEQIEEMRQYFAAWRDQNATHRNYVNYFKPVLCYMEGMWTYSGKTIEESFSSSRHFLDANSWLELQERVRFTSFSGSKTRLENLAFLPTTIIGYINETIPIIAQWNYRILCNPIKKNLPTNRLIMVDSLGNRLNLRQNMYQRLRSRTARFIVNPADSDKFENRRFQRGLLDDLMEEIPGLDNYPGNLTDVSIDSVAMNWDGSTTKDSSRYHRWYKLVGKDAFGLDAMHRGFNDDYLFAAQTNQTNIAGMTLKSDAPECKNPKLQNKCPAPITQKWTWAIPLEIIYLTPLASWNPYKLVNKGPKSSVSGKTVTEGNRNGECSTDKAFSGINSATYYMTPAEFYSGFSEGKSTADTVSEFVCVLDSNNVVRRTKASGVYTFLPPINGVGSLRTRYPIAPIHAEGSSTWKEMDAIKELLMDPAKFAKYFWSNSSTEFVDENLTLELGDSTKANLTKHRHTVVLSKDQVTALRFGQSIIVNSDQSIGHSHMLELKFNTASLSFKYTKCDNSLSCFCMHPKTLLAKPK